MLQVAIGGLAAMPTVGSVIAGATSVEQVEPNVEAAPGTPDGCRARPLAADHRLSLEFRVRPQASMLPRLGA